MNVRQLQQLLVDNVEIGDLILAKNDLKTLDQGYGEAGVDTPEWVLDQLAAVSVEVNRRNQAELAKRLKNAQNRRAALATPDEKRTKLDAEIADLQKKLGG